jgi:membrane protein YdbS with pleckstrin-like domain
METENLSWTPLEPGQLRAMRISAAILSLIIAVVAIGAALIVYHAIEPRYALYVFLPIALICAGLFWLVVIAPARRFQNWGYCRLGNELHIAHGTLTHIETSIAFHRVQHIDVSQGPIERMCGVMRLVLNTAGTMNSRISLPGLSRETAEALRDEIRAHIRADLT